MEANKPEAERVRDMGAAALRSGQLGRATKLLKKSLQLYPLPGVEALIAQAERQQQNASSNSGGASGENGSNNTTNNNNTSRTASAAAASAATTSSSSSTAGTQTSTGRSYTQDQVAIVKKVLAAKEGGRGAHYRVLSIEQNASEADIKKAYRKLALKLHPDKNGAPHADEAFKAVGLAYATLSDPQKRTIYDRYGEEDPDNRGGGGAANMARHFRHGNAQEVSPEDIFNMFFGGGMPGGGAGGFRRAPGGFHVYTNGFGGGFGGGMPAGGGGFRAGGRRPGQQQRQQQQQEEPSGLGALIQLMPLILIMLLSFFNFNDSGGVGFAGGSARMPGMDKYFSLVHKPPFTNPLATRLTSVKDIPFYVSDKFLRTYYRDRYQLAQVERMVERAYEEYLVEECRSQYKFKNQLEKEARMNRNDNKLQHRAEQFELSRCKEIEELFPKRGRVLKEQQNSQKKKQQRKKHSYR